MTLEHVNGSPLDPTTRLVLQIYVDQMPVMERFEEPQGKTIPHGPQFQTSPKTSTRSKSAMPLAAFHDLMIITTNQPFLRTHALLSNLCHNSSRGAGFLPKTYASLYLILCTINNISSRAARTKLHSSIDISIYGTIPDHKPDKRTEDKCGWGEFPVCQLGFHPTSSIRQYPFDSVGTEPFPDLLPQ